MRWRTLVHVDKYGPYVPPATAASTSTFSSLLDNSVEKIVRHALGPTMDQLGQRLRTEIPFVRGGTHSDGDRSSDQSGDPTVAETGRVTRLHVSGVRPPPISVGETIQIPSRHGPLSISGDAAMTYRTCNNTY
ncbi:hypothetical protein R1sor_004837 [Riccia sorocarpa]|uniref:Uncharacterized protein n=1 Tax=Riccia sorocarpa TaxID=122646 RepID=A0ABD3HJT1_9MARC